ncbi:RNase III [Glarea lozoyensis ATCC 20868]|uniref:RNase III n=2 Tax=Glarea lozoyensis TaxID=101852 RepID=S3CHQ0_GLAL2|nr:RNase III [Glarea lozoyensis ATCC 20868]EHL02284.1 putative Ribonuclease 3 [Glarea lozoyensis 74030]EPE24784.1 RNase III [Glarea lozoyensis ATCC 20868]
MNRERSIAGAQAILDYTFRNPELCWEALQAKGAGGYPEGNKRLALCGDAVLRLLIVQLWYPTGRTAEHASNVVATTASNDNLAVIGRQFGLPVLINKNPSQKGEVPGVRQIADAVEALLGAAKLDGADETTLEGIMGDTWVVVKEYTCGARENVMMVVT